MNDEPQPARYVRSLIFSTPETVDSTPDLDEALGYLHRRQAVRAIRDYLGRPWRVVPIFLKV